MKNLRNWLREKLGVNLLEKRVDAVASTVHNLANETTRLRNKIAPDKSERYGERERRRARKRHPNRF